ncbi:ASCH domain-containing protein [bacterium]|nr:MAG: ASCH domain-containing protein [bacterium]
MSARPLRPYRIGWYGDDGLGERLIQAVLEGRKTATAAPSYDPEEGAEGELLALVDKGGKRRGTLRITRVELRRFSDFDEPLAARLGAPLADIKAMTSFANSRPIGPDEEMRVTYFELVP